MASRQVAIAAASALPRILATSRFCSAVIACSSYSLLPRMTFASSLASETISLAILSRSARIRS